MGAGGSRDIASTNQSSYNIFSGGKTLKYNRYNIDAPLGVCLLNPDDFWNNPSVSDLAAEQEITIPQKRLKRGPIF